MTRTNVPVGFTDEEIEALRSHFDEEGLDPDLESDLRDSHPEDTDYLDVRRRWRRLLEIWAGRKASPMNVHTSHCCEVHGCKYSDDWCPVATKKMTQQYLCERCEDDVFARLAQAPKAEAYALGVTGLDPEAGVYVLVDGEKLFLAPPSPEEGVTPLEGLKAQRSDIVWAIQTAYLAGVTG